MTGEQIIQELIDHLDLHLKGPKGAIGQEPYRGDFFKLFREAYNGGYFEMSARPLLRGDALRDILTDRWTTGGSKKEKERRALMENLLSKWDEWRYAWD